MATRYKDKDSGGVVVSVNGAWVSYLHTVIAYSELVFSVQLAFSIHRCHQS
jgi:hypothetical protein